MVDVAKQVKQKRIKGWSVVGIQNGYGRYYQKRYLKFVQDKRDGWENIELNRWCQLCADEDRVDLLDPGISPDWDKNVFYAHRDELFHGGACHGCYWAAVKESDTRGTRKRRDSRRKQGR